MISFSFLVQTVLNAVLLRLGRAEADHYSWRLPNLALMLAMSILTASIVKRESKVPHIMVYWILYFVVIIVLVFAYGFVVPRIVTSRASILALGFYRFVFHPLFWGVGIFMANVLLVRLRLPHMRGTFGNGNPVDV